MIKTVYDDAAINLAWWSARPKSFSQFLRETREETIKNLSEATDPIKIGRFQGKLELANQFIKLEEDLHGTLEKRRGSAPGASGQVTARNSGNA